MTTALRMLALVGPIVASLAVPGTAADGEALWTLLEGGGQVVMIRHAITTPGVGDPPGMRLQDCKTQRNLTDQGRADARRVGAAFKARAIPVDRVLSSPWCRCLETARLAFREPQVWTPLGNLYGRSELRDQQVKEMQATLSEPRPGGNTILVSHGSTISAATGINPDTAEMVIITPQGNGKFAVGGRLVVR
jgi:phosphohistidine phosphatase SixA